MIQINKAFHLEEDNCEITKNDADYGRFISDLSFSGVCPPARNLLAPVITFLNSLFIWYNTKQHVLKA